MHNHAHFVVSVRWFMVLLLLLQVSALFSSRHVRYERRREVKHVRTVAAELEMELGWKFRLREEPVGAVECLLWERAVLLRIRSIQPGQNCIAGWHGNALVLVVRVVVGAVWKRLGVRRIGHLNPRHEAVGAVLRRGEGGEGDRRPSEARKGAGWERAGGQVHGDVGTPPGRIGDGRRLEGEATELVEDGHGRLGLEGRVEERGRRLASDQAGLAGERGHVRGQRHLVRAREGGVGGGGEGRVVCLLRRRSGRHVPAEERVLEAVVRLYPARGGE